MALSWESTSCFSLALPCPKRGRDGEEEWWKEGSWLLAPSPAHLQGVPEELQLLSPTQPNGKRPQPWTAERQILIRCKENSSTQISANTGRGGQKNHQLSVLGDFQVVKALSSLIWPQSLPWAGGRARSNYHQHGLETHHNLLQTWPSPTKRWELCPARLGFHPTQTALRKHTTFGSNFVRKLLSCER